MSSDYTIHAGWLINGKNQPPECNIFISIKNSIIHSITNHPERDSKIIDLSSSTVIPCLIDSHVHLAWSGTHDLKIRKEQIDAEFNTTKETIKNNLNRHLHNGITTVRDGGDKNGYTLKYKNESHYNTKIKISSPGYAFHKSGRYGSIIGIPLGTSGELEMLIRDSSGIDHLKIVNSGLNSLTNFGEQTPPQFSIDELSAIARIAKKNDLGIMVHANGDVPVKEAIEAGCTSIEHGFFMGKENLKRMAGKNIFWVPTAVTMKAYSEHASEKSIKSEIARKNLDHQIEQLSLAKEYGVPVVMGTDAGGMGVEHGDSLISEMEIFIKAGYSIVETIHCATGRAAGLLNLNEGGKIEPGMKADMICISADPDNLMTAIKSDIHIFFSGEEVNN